MTGQAAKRTIYAGDDLPLGFTWRNSEGAAIDVTGYSFEAKIHRGTMIVAEADEVSITNAVGGAVQINFSEAQTIGISPPGALYEVRVRFTNTLGHTETLFVMPLEVRR